MSRKLGLVLVGMASLSMAGCSREKPVVVHDEMTQQIVPNAQVIWDVTNASMDDNGNPSVEKMKPDDWTKMDQAIANLMASLERMETAEQVTVVSPGQKIMDEDVEGGYKPAAIQKTIDKDPEAFRAHARTQKEMIERIGKAVQQRDLKKTYELSAELDGSCEGCHKAIWFGKGS